MKGCNESIISRNESRISSDESSGVALSSGASADSAHFHLYIMFQAGGRALGDGGPGGGSLLEALLPAGSNLNPTPRFIEG